MECSSPKRARLLHGSICSTLVRKYLWRSCLGRDQIFFSHSSRWSFGIQSWDQNRRDERGWSNDSNNLRTARIETSLSALFRFTFRSQRTGRCWRQRIKIHDPAAIVCRWSSSSMCITHSTGLLLLLFLLLLLLLLLLSLLFWGGARLTHSTDNQPREVQGCRVL
jgi:hypothetical protein